MKMQKAYYPEIDALKGFAIFLVILGHSIIVFPVNLLENAWCSWIYNFIYSFHMPLFFLLSGFVFSYPGNYFSYLWKKIKRIAVPFFVFNLFDMIARFAFSSFFNRPRGLKESLIKMVVSGGEFWFLYILFIIYIIFPIFSALKKKSIKLSILVECVLLFAVLVLKAQISFWVVPNLLYNLFFFHTGFLLKYGYPTLKKHMERTPESLIVATGIAMLFLLNISLSYQAEAIAAEALWIRVAQIGNAFLGILIAYLMTAWMPFCQFFSRFGPWTLQLYLVNGWALGVSRTLACIVFEMTNPAMIVLFNLVIDLGMAYIGIKYFCARFQIFRMAMGIAVPRDQ